MHNISTHLSKIVLFDFVLKYGVKTTRHLPRLNKVTLSVKLSSNYKKSVYILIGILTFLRPCLTSSKKNIISLSLRKGDPVGVKIILRKRQIENFLLLFLFEILPSSKNLTPLIFMDTSLHWQLKDVFEYEDMSDIYIYIAETPTLDIVINGTNLNANFFLGWRLPSKNFLDK